MSSIIGQGLIALAANIFISSSPEVLNLKEAVRLGLLQNPSIREAKEKVIQGQNARAQILSRSGPQVNSVLKYDRQKDALTSNTPAFGGDSYNHYEFGLEGRQTLLKRGYLAAIFSGGRDKKIREIDYQIAERDFIFLVVRAYYQTLFFQKQIELLTETEKVFKESLSFTQRRQAIGRSQKLDVLDLKSQVALIGPRLKKAQNDLKAATAYLVSQLVLRDIHTLRLEGSLTLPDAKSLIDYLNKTEPNVLEIERAKEERLRFEDEMTAKLGVHWPKLDGTGSFGRTGYVKSDLADSDATRWAVGLELNVPLFSGFLYLHEKAELESIERQKAQQEQIIRNQNAYEKIRSREDLESSIAVIDASREAASLVMQALREAKVQYERSAIDYLRLLTSQKEALETQTSLIDAEMSAVDSLIFYFSAYGYPPDTLVSALSGEIK